MSQPGDAAAMSGEHTFIIPEKKIKNAMDMGKWIQSEAYKDLLRFIDQICQAIQGKRLTDAVSISVPAQGILDAINALEKLAIETPPIDQPQRFGNTAYRMWHTKMSDVAGQLISTILPENLHAGVDELKVYLTDSFGNATRIDYGTGHELNFVMFLMCLYKLNVLKAEDEPAIGLKVFDLYVNFCRKLQVTYRMEPAGSHGVWSLDDYQFIPFIWGSAQLSANSPIEPVQFVEDKWIDEYRKQYMFISCIDYIRQVKTGHFAEHSNQLWSISAVQTWGKICTGLIKMYQKEVLSKFPVIQHVYFGSLFELKPATTKMPAPVTPRVAMGPPKIV